MMFVTNRLSACSTRVAALARTPPPVSPTVAEDYMEQVLLSQTSPLHRRTEYMRLFWGEDARALEQENRSRRRGVFYAGRALDPK